MSLVPGWCFDPIVTATAIASLAAYVVAAARYRALRSRPWPRTRVGWFVCAILSGVVAIESPLAVAGESFFAPHMIEHVILTDVTAPCVLLSAPLLLVLGIAPTRIARTIVRFLKSPIGHGLASPLFTWPVFILALWLVHETGFFEAALAYEPLHLLEHAIYLGTALLFWFPVIAIGPTPWANGPLAYPVRMLYLIVAMPAEGMLGFAIYGARHVVYPHYARAGIADQQMAGEIMWIAGTLAMFVAFMFVGSDWARSERRLGERLNARAEARADRVR